MSEFIQLTQGDCAYLLELIEDMDSSTMYTERQRGYTVPKLIKIQADPRSAKLAYQDVEYLLDLIEDDDLEEYAQARSLAQSSLLQIQNLQQTRFEQTQDVDKQRALRRARRQDR